MKLEHAFICLPERGVTLHYATIEPALQANPCPCVVLVHGWPGKCPPARTSARAEILLSFVHIDCYYTWRHALPALASKGYRAIAPDNRGFGWTSLQGDPATHDLAESYDHEQVCHDLVISCVSAFKAGLSNRALLEE